jgi:hypothetical protein
MKDSGGCATEMTEASTRWRRRSRWDWFSSEPVAWIESALWASPLASRDGGGVSGGGGCCCEDDDSAE